MHMLPPHTAAFSGPMAHGLAHVCTDRFCFPCPASTLECSLHLPSPQPPLQMELWRVLSQQAPRLPAPCPYTNTTQRIADTPTSSGIAPASGHREGTQTCPSQHPSPSQYHIQYNHTHNLQQGPPTPPSCAATVTVVNTHRDVGTPSSASSLLQLPHLGTPCAVDSKLCGAR